MIPKLIKKHALPGVFKYSSGNPRILYSAPPSPPLPLINILAHNREVLEKE